MTSQRVFDLNYDPIESHMKYNQDDNLFNEIYNLYLKMDVANFAEDSTKQIPIIKKELFKEILIRLADDSKHIFNWKRKYNKDIDTYKNAIIKNSLKF